MVFDDLHGVSRQTWCLMTNMVFDDKHGVLMTNMVFDDNHGA